MGIKKYVSGDEVVNLLSMREKTVEVSELFVMLDEKPTNAIFSVVNFIHFFEERIAMVEGTDRKPIQKPQTNVTITEVENVPDESGGFNTERTEIETVVSVGATAEMH